jgi:hypothetical protein
MLRRLIYTAHIVGRTVLSGRVSSSLQGTQLAFALAWLRTIGQHKCQLDEALFTNIGALSARQYVLRGGQIDVGSAGNASPQVSQVLLSLQVILSGRSNRQ